MSDRAPYSRVYWSVLFDEKFSGIRSDVRHFGSWCLMLVAADMSWPAPAYVPPPIPKASLRKLIEVGLVDQIEHGMFRIHGLDAERGRRSYAARTHPNGENLGSKRGELGENLGSKRGVNGPLGRDEAETRQRRDKDEDETRQGTDPADTYFSLTGRFPKGRLLSWIDREAEKYGKDQISAAMATAHSESAGLEDLMTRASDIAARIERAAVIKERSDELIRNAEKRTGISILRRAPEEDLSEDEIQRQVDEYNAKHGKAG